tara:strand:- start:795 stop:1046 length:252 start_codon:yes stop_codon:yes gene_type:complete
MNKERNQSSGLKALATLATFALVGVPSGCQTNPYTTPVQEFVEDGHGKRVNYEVGSAPKRCGTGDAEIRKTIEDLKTYRAQKN